MRGQQSVGDIQGLFEGLIEYQQYRADLSW
jgi:hypothetical protein